MINLSISSIRFIFWIVTIFFIYSQSTTEESATIIRQKLQGFLSAGNYKEVLRHLKKIEDDYGTLVIDMYAPSLYLYKGVAYHGLHALVEAETSFREAVTYFPNEVRSWINLGEIQTLLLKFNESVVSYEEAFKYGERTALPRLLTAKGWVDSWENFEFISAEVEKDALTCGKDQTSYCIIESSFGLEYTDIPISIAKYIHSLAPVTQNSEYIIHPQARANIWTTTVAPSSKGSNQILTKQGNRRLRLGVISSDFGVHPVSSLIRGVLDMIDKSRIELFCFSVTDAISWWRYNLSQSVEHFDVLQSINSQDGASIIASKKVDILIDLNGHTKNSGLSYLSHRPAPVQISFLGLPSTTSAKFIDYYIGDNIALPPEHRNHFSESLILMQPCYISNDYAQLQGDVVRLYSGKNRAKRKALGSDMDITSASFLFGTISNSQKMDPYIFHVWMNILRRYGGSMLSWTQHSGMTVAMKNLRQYGQYYGISEKRLVLADLAPWLDHLYKKTSVDMFLDTAVKNGHTTGLDGIWAGVPTVTLGGGSSMPTRAGESIAEALGNHVGVTYSLKEYEDFIYQFYDSSYLFLLEQSESYISNPNILLKRVFELTSSHYNTDILYPNIGNLTSGYQKLRAWRHHIQKQRIISPLFDTKNWTTDFTRLMEATWDATNIAARKKFHVNVENDDQEESKSKDKYDNKHRFTSDEPIEKMEQHFFGGVSIKMKKRNGLSEGIIQDKQNNILFDSKRNVIDNEDIPKVANHFKIYHIFAICRKPEDKIRSIRLEQAYDPQSEVFKGTIDINIPSTIVDMNQNQSNRIDTNSTLTMESNGIVGRVMVTNESLANSENSTKHRNSIPTEIPSELFESSKLIFLNIGGIQKIDGWLNINAEEQPFPGIQTHSDYIRPAGNLTGFPNGSVSTIYSCHNLEHNSFGDGAVYKILHEWNRVLRPGGLLLLSVPDLRALARLYLDKSLSIQERWMSTLMVYGSQVSPFDYHKIGFDEWLLVSMLSNTGFCDIERVGSFHLFEDSSELVYKGYHISLNVAAKKCSNTNMDVDIELEHQAEPFDRLNAY